MVVSRCVSFFLCCFCLFLVGGKIEYFPTPLTLTCSACIESDYMFPSLLLPALPNLLYRFAVLKQKTGKSLSRWALGLVCFSLWQENASRETRFNVNRLVGDFLRNDWQLLLTWQKKCGKNVEKRKNVAHPWKAQTNLTTIKYELLRVQLEKENKKKKENRH